MTKQAPGRATMNAGEAFHTAPSRLRTVRDLLRFAVTRFNEAELAFGHGSDNALDEAAYLVCHALSLPLDKLDVFVDARLLPAEIDLTLALLRRRVMERVPAAYLTREAWLGSFRFYVDERVIVPRSYIANWLMNDPAPWIPQPEAVATALELCTGSGCLAIVMAQCLPNAAITAVDISRAALEVASRNVADYGLQERLALQSGDLFGGVKRSARYDVIVANPPYVSADAMRTLPLEYKHEPALALAGGEDGLDLVRRILAGARRHLKPQGILVVEVGHARDRVEQAFPATPFTWLEIDAVDDAVFLLTREDLPSPG